MASILEGLAAGLRTAGGTLSQSVYNTQRQEEQTALDRKQRNKELTLGVLVKGAESGALSPDQFNAAVKKLGVDLPGMGPSYEAQGHRLKLDEASDYQRRRAEFDAMNADTQPGNTVDMTGTDPVNSVANRTNFDEYMLRAEQATKLRLKDDAERFTKLAELELKNKEKQSSIGQIIAEREEIARRNPEDPRLKYYDNYLQKETTAAPKNAQFVELPTGRTVGGKPEFQSYAVVGQNEDGTPKLVPQGKAAVKGSLVDVNVKGDQKTFENEQKMKDDFIKESKTFVDVRDGYTRMKSALEQKDITAASTLAGATSFMKLLDPGSVVRESALGMAMAAPGAIDRALNCINVLRKGTVLTESQRKDFLAIGEQLYKAASANQDSLESRYREDAKQYGLNPDRIVKSYRIKGDEKKGKVYKSEKDIESAILSGEIKSDKDAEDAYYEFYKSQGK